MQLTIGHTLPMVQHVISHALLGMQGMTSSKYDKSKAEECISTLVGPPCVSRVEIRDITKSLFGKTLWVNFTSYMVDLKKKMEYFQGIIVG
jgi:hypothetical protein